MAFVDIAIIGGVTSVTVPGIAAGAGAGAAAAAGLGGVLGTGLTMGEIGSGLGAASSGLNLAGKLFGSSGQQGPAGKVGNVGGAGETGNVKPFVIDPRATTAAEAVPTPFGNPTQEMPQQAPQDFYSQEQDQQEGQQMKHFWDGGDVSDALDRVSYMDTYLANDNPTQNLITSQSYLGSPIEAGSVRNSLQGSSEDGSSIWDWFKKTNPKTGEKSYDWGKIAMLGLGGAGIASLLTKGQQNANVQQPTAQQYGLGARLASNYQPIRFARAAAGGAVSDLSVPGLLALRNPYNNEAQDVFSAADGGLAGLSPNQNFPMAQQQASRYAVPSQMPVSATDVRLAHQAPAAMAGGGLSDLGSYSDGGRMLKGPGDGMSDNIPATIAGKQPARLADGEFVMPADVVSHLGNGSTDAGAKKLYAMMDKVRKARTGTKKQGKQINPDKYIPV